MNFTVEAEDLDSFAVQVGRAAEDMQQADQYAQKYGDVGLADGGLFSPLVGAHSAVADRVGAAMTAVHKLLAAAQKELSGSATYYRETDQGNAATVDATYPASKR